MNLLAIVATSYFFLNGAWSSSLQDIATQDALVGAIETFEKVTETVGQVDTFQCQIDTPCSWLDTVPKLKPGDRLEGEEVLFVTHASNLFNRNQSIKESVNRRITAARAKGVKVVYLLDHFYKRFMSSYFLDRHPDYLYLSPGGDHELQLKVKNLVFTGGFFESCAAETVRDAILNTDKGIPIRLTYLTDSLYVRDEGKGGTPLQDVLKGRSNEDMLQFLEANYFENGELGDQNWHKERYATFKDFTFKIFRNGKEIGKFGRGARAVQMNFVID